jgi:peptide/nickel transport system permease protein
MAIDPTLLRGDEPGIWPRGVGRGLKAARDIGQTHAKGRAPFAIGLALIGVFVLMALFAPLIAPFSPTRADASAILLPPSAMHWLGTDDNGTDILSRILYAPRIDLVVPVIAMLASLALGSILGTILGFYGGQRNVRGFVSDQTMRVVDIVQAFPVFVLALALVSTLGRSAANIVYALIVLETPIFLRLTRSTVLTVRNRTFVEAAFCSGTPIRSVILRQILPNSVGPALVNASVLTGSGILITASLSFIGAGIQAPEPELGSMVSTGAQDMVTGQWWPALFPGLCIGLMVLAFALVGEGIRRRLTIEGA